MIIPHNFSPLTMAHMAGVVGYQWRPHPDGKLKHPSGEFARGQTRMGSHGHTTNHRCFFLFLVDHPVSGGSEFVTNAQLASTTWYHPSDVRILRGFSLVIIPYTLQKINPGSSIWGFPKIGVPLNHPL